MDLANPLINLFRLTESQKTALKKLNLKTAADLLYHFPVRYGDTASIKNIDSLQAGETAVIFGRISRLKTSKGFRTKIPMADGMIEDETGTIKAVWFNQPYLAKMIGENSLVRAEGKVSQRKKTGEIYLSNPKIEKVDRLPTGVGESLFATTGADADNQHILYPVYPESRGITSNWFYHAIQKIIKEGALQSIADPVPKEILDQYHLPCLKTALIWIHAPKKESDAIAARKRFAFEEVFFIQLERQKTKRQFERNRAPEIAVAPDTLTRFTSRFPFTATGAQTRAIGDILRDIGTGHPMGRLLEGDVGSGKTFVAATAAYATVMTKPAGSPPAGGFGSLQVAYMAPTEILATQHFESFISYFSPPAGGLPINIALITGSGCRKFPSKLYAEKRGTNAEETRKKTGTALQPWTDISRSQLLKWVANGEIPIVIGTHALIQKSVKFKNLGLVIIDEQHRFGISQRHTLARGKNAEHAQNYAENDDPLLYKDLTYRIRDSLFSVKKELGAGHKELVYQQALAEEFTKKKLAFSREEQIPILYNKKKIGTYIPDFVVENKIIVELKALTFTGSTEKKQLWNYLKGSKYRLALLANFGPTELTITRVIYDKARASASVPQSSAFVPHFLSMTATPIPRTLALTIFGDLDLTLLDEMPAGRKPIITQIVLPTNREQIYEKVRAELSAGRQAYIICPRIDEPDPNKEMALLAKSVKEEARRLKKSVFPEFEIDIVHSKLRDNEKEKVMNRFKKGEIKILVATSVVEVGVNVPNATVIIIEGAERFGLAQLHQLRGRVLRSTHQAYCYVFAETKSKKSLERLRALQSAANGFELAEYDLKLRGPGELSGNKQWGISDIGMEALKNLKMVEAARAEATRLLDEDESLKNYPQIVVELEKRKKEEIHFE